MTRRRPMTRLVGSFTGRIFFVAAALHAVLIPFLFKGVGIIVEQGYQTQFIDHIRHDAHQISVNIRENFDSPPSPELIRELFFSNRISYLGLTAETGESLAVTNGRMQFPEIFKDDFAFGAHGDSIYHITVPLQFSNSGVSAVLQIGYDESVTRAQIDQTYELATILAIGYLLMSLVLVAVISPQLTRPLYRLRDAAQRITAGEPSAELRINSGIIEIVDLAEDLEEMHRELIAKSQAVIARESRIRAIMDNVADGILTIDECGDIESLNPAAARIFGYSTAEVIGQSLDVLLAQPYFCDYHQSGNPRARPGIDNLVIIPPHETVGLHKDGHSFPMEMVISEMARDKSVLFVAIVRDITERKQAEAELKALQEDLELRVIKRTKELAALNKELEHQALHDSLTELPNRVLLQDRLLQSILTAQREHTQAGLLLMDLDRFKEINDTLGHHYGDLVLQETAARMRAILRESDTIARLGGDEFAILLPEMGSDEDAINAACKIMSAMDKPVTLQDQTFHVGASIGIATYPRDGTDVATLMRHADVAMYVAKREASGFAVYSPEQDSNSIGRLAMVSELRQAIELKRLQLFYQPKVDLQQGCIIGVEAVVRWDHPERGLLLPDDFVPLAEYTDLIKPLTNFVLEEALHQLHLWHKDNLTIHLAINLSAKHLHDPQLPQKIAGLLTAWQIDPAALELEITESAIMGNPANATETLNELDAMGITLAIDDFGTGYSSLIYLKQLPVDEIKIDKSFVIGMQHNKEDLVIVRSTIDLAHNMGRRVVAEGVETKEAMDTLIELGCDMAQGYYISRPVTAGVLTGWLHQAPWHTKCTVRKIQRY